MAKKSLAVSGSFRNILKTESCGAGVLMIHDTRNIKIQWDTRENFPQAEVLGQSVSWLVVIQQAAADPKETTAPPNLIVVKLPFDPVQRGQSCRPSCYRHCASSQESDRRRVRLHLHGERRAAHDAIGVAVEARKLG